MLIRRVLVLVVAAALLGARQEKAASAPASPMMKALEGELERAFTKLKGAGEAPVYYLSYRVYETESVSLSASYGAIDDTRKSDRSRTLDVD
ncbi:MAG TPA: hypothetical protein VJU16_02085, partial [Planctomycetota bacterium]|nr:hypothetical protein [Planctomycetota bacterium]